MKTYRINIVSKRRTNEVTRLSSDKLNGLCDTQVSKLLTDRWQISSVNYHYSHITWVA